MAKIEIPIRVYMGEIEEIINELKHLQTYKLFEGDDKVLINRDDVIKIFANHLCTEILNGSTIEPERKKVNMIIHRNECPCDECAYYESGRYNHAHYCNKVNQSICQHRGNAFHRAGQWLIPCGAQQRLFKHKKVEEKNKEMSKVSEMEMAYGEYFND